MLKYEFVRNDKKQIISMENLDGDWLKGGIEYTCVLYAQLVHMNCQIWLGNNAECVSCSVFLIIQDRR